MIPYSLGNSVRLGQVAYATPYPPGGLEWGQGWGRFAPSSPKVVLPRSAAAGGGVGYTSEGTVLSQQDIADISAVTGPGSAPAAAAAAASPAGAESGPSNLSIAAAGVAAAAILTAFVA